MSKRILPNIDELKRLYLDEKKSCGEICRMYGLKSGSRSNLSKMLKNHGVMIRRETGENHHGWKGGRIKKGSMGYIGIWNPTHERADNQGYVYEHTLIMEKHLGRLPNKKESIHHIDFDVTNNDINNLHLCSYSNHAKLHKKINSLMRELIKNNLIIFDRDKNEYKMNNDYLKQY